MTDETTRERTMARRARERDEDREAGRPQRGLFTGRGRKRSRDEEDEIEPDEDRFVEHDDDMDDDDDEPTVRGSGRPRTGAKRTLLGAIRQVPSYLRLMVGLMGDGRVSRIDRFLVVAAAAYMISPLDFIPDLVPFFGQADDIFLVVLALRRLIDNAGRRVLMDHWKGDPDDLSDVHLTSLVSAAAFFLPPGIKRRLRRMVRRS